MSNAYTVMQGLTTDEAPTKGLTLVSCTGDSCKKSAD